MLQRQIDVYRLDPNTTYVFKIWANNQLGPGEETALEATTLHDIEEIGELCVLLLSVTNIKPVVLKLLVAMAHLGYILFWLHNY
jgi:hypothetical protein